MESAKLKFKGAPFGRRSLVALAASLALNALTCAAPPAPPAAAVGSMPEQGQWQGVYKTARGHLHLIVNGDQVEGAWRTTTSDAYGKLQGKLSGNFLRFRWVQEKQGAASGNEPKYGRGYLVYVVPGEGLPHELLGEWGVGDTEHGHTWKARKRPEIEPNLSFAQPGSDGDRAGSKEREEPGLAGYYEPSSEDLP